MAGRLPDAGAAPAAPAAAPKSSAGPKKAATAKPAASKTAPTQEALQTAGRMSPEEDPATSTRRSEVLDREDDFERFVKQQLALLDEELRSIGDLEPALAQEQLCALEAQLRSKRRDWVPVPQESIITAGAPPPRRKRDDPVARIATGSPRAALRRELPRELQASGVQAASQRLIPMSSEGEALRSQALERRVHRLIEKRREREQQLELREAPPALESPRNSPGAVKRQPKAGLGGGSPLPNTGALPPALPPHFSPFPTTSAAAAAAATTSGPLHSPEASQYHLDTAAVLSGRTWSPGHARPAVAQSDKVDPVTQQEWPGPSTTSRSAGHTEARTTEQEIPLRSVTGDARSDRSPQSRRRDRSGSPTHRSGAPLAAARNAGDGTDLNVERIRQQLKPGVGTMLQDVLNPRGRSSYRDAPVPESSDLLANAAELLLRQKQDGSQAAGAGAPQTPPATDSLLYDVSMKLREHAAQDANRGGSQEDDQRAKDEERLRLEEERVKAAIEAEKRKREDEERARAALEAEKSKEREREEERVRAALEAEKRKEREREEERVRAALEDEKRKEREREEERIRAALEDEKRKEREREEEERIKAEIESQRRKEREDEERAKIAAAEAEKRRSEQEAERRKEREIREREDEERRVQSAREVESKRTEEEPEAPALDKRMASEKEEQEDRDRLRALEMDLLLEPQSSLPEVLLELEEKIQAALIGSRKAQLASDDHNVTREAILPSMAPMDDARQEASHSARGTRAARSPQIAATAFATKAREREPPSPRSPAARPPKVPIVSSPLALQEMAVSPPGPTSPLAGPRFGLEQYEPYERFINHQLALLDEELRSIHAREPYVQEQLQALEVQLRAVKLGWTPPEDLQRNAELRKAQEENERAEMRWRNFQATKIQSMVRKRQARKKVAAEKKKEEAREQQKSVAAMRQRMAEQEQRRMGACTLRLQAIRRGKVTRRWFLQQQEDRKRQEQEQRQLQESRAKQLQIEATRKILQERETQRLTIYALKLQASWRGYITRKRFAAVQQERQRVERQKRRLQEASLTSKRLQEVEFQQRTRAAMKIQGAFRCGKAKKELRRLKMNKAKQEHDKWDALKLMFRRERESLEKLREDKARRTKEHLEKQVQRYRHKVQGDPSHHRSQALEERRLERKLSSRRSEAASDTSSVMLAEAASMLLRNRHLEKSIRGGEAPQRAALRDMEAATDPSTDSLLRDVAVKLQESAVVKMQAQFRGAISRRRVNDFKAKLVEQREAALKERKLVDEERRAARRRDWDTKVSAMRRRLAHLEGRKQNEAAVALQCHWRGFAERQRLQTSGELVQERRRKKQEEEAEERRKVEVKNKAIAEAAKRKKETEEQVQGRIRAAVEQKEIDVEDRIRAAVEASEERIKAAVVAESRKMPPAPYPMPMPAAPYPMQQEGYMPQMAPMAMPPMPAAAAPGGGSTVNIRIGSGGVDYDGGAPQQRAPDPVLQERLQALEAQLQAIKDEKEQEELRRAQEEEENEWRSKNYQATKIQSMIRGQHGRREASAERKKVEAAAQLRAQQNSVQAMRKMLEEREQRRLGLFAVKLQARWRGKQARKKYMAEQEERRRVERQQRRQQEIDAWSQRLVAVELAQRRRAAEMIQGAFRGRKAKKELKRLKLIKDKQELAQMDEELKLRLQREREEMIRQMEAEKKRIRDMNRTVWLHIPFAEPTPEPPKAVTDRMAENRQRREESQRKRQQRLAEIQAMTAARSGTRSGSPKSPRRRRKDGSPSPGRSMSPPRPVPAGEQRGLWSHLGVHSQDAPDDPQQ